MDLKIGSFFSAARTATTNAASSVYGFGRYMLGKGCSVCSSLVGKVGQVAGRFIPTAVSNTVQAYPRSSACAGGLFLGGAVTHVAYRFFRGESTARVDSLNNVRNLCAQVAEDTPEVVQLKTTLLDLIG